jgi:hypothetical protein
MLSRMGKMCCWGDTPPQQHKPLMRFSPNFEWVLMLKLADGEAVFNGESY